MSNTVVTEIKENGETLIQEIEKSPSVIEPKQKVSVSVGVTKSTGNYESIKVHCTFEEYCDSDKRGETFDLLVKEAEEKLASIIEDFDKHKKNLAKGHAIARSIRNGSIAAEKSTKWILDQEMKSHFGESYSTFVKVITDRGHVTENEAREAIWQLRDGDISIFGEWISENIEKRITDSFDTEVL